MLKKKKDLKKKNLEMSSAKNTLHLDEREWIFITSEKIVSDLIYLKTGQLHALLGSFVRIKKVVLQ